MLRSKVASRIDKSDTAKPHEELSASSTCRYYISYITHYITGLEQVTDSFMDSNPRQYNTVN